jgi:tetratricopeptide (TPR) repeat protein
MMRFTGGIATGLAVLFLAPGILPPLRSGNAAGRAEDPVGKQLAIAEIEEIAANLRHGSREAALRLIEATEDPILDTGGREARIERLQSEIEQLQRRADLATETSAKSTPAAALPPPRKTSVGANQVHVTAAASPPAYSADPLRQAVACARAGQHQRALMLLERLPASAATEYWRGKALLSLGRAPEALVSFDRSFELDASTPEAKLSKSEADYLRWRAKLSPESRPAAASAEQLP